MAQNRQFSLNRVQWIIWIILFIIHVLSLLPYDSLSQAIVYSVIFVGSYFIIIYGNASFLIPRLYEKGHRGWYVIVAILFICLIAFARYYASFYVYNRFYAPKPSLFKWSSTVSSLISVLLVYVSSVLFYIALNYFRLRQKQEQLQKKNAETELNLLKAQVQPHFLFNTLNNIYFIAQRESPATAALLEQLSLIMRYFVDEAPKDRISLAVELNFIKSYIELEKMRMRFPLEITIIEADVTESISVPPMLLIPLVENVFKHGIDKSRNDNFIYLSVTTRKERLIVVVENRLVEDPELVDKSEVGLKNLGNRLQLLYGDDYMLHAGDAGSIFHAQLNIPL